MRGADPIQRTARSMLPAMTASGTEKSKTVVSGPRRALRAMSRAKCTRCGGALRLALR
jgi:hypothetical protein